jgi:hypothetical protein
VVYVGKIFLHMISCLLDLFVRMFRINVPFERLKKMLTDILYRSVTKRQLVRFLSFFFGSSILFFATLAPIIVLRFYLNVYCLDGTLYHSAICYPVILCPVCAIVNLTQTNSQPTSFIESWGYWGCSLGDGLRVFYRDTVEKNGIILKNTFSPTQTIHPSIHPSMYLVLLGRRCSHQLSTRVMTDLWFAFSRSLYSS